MILDRTIFYPQGGGQPADTGFIRIHDLDVKFLVHDVRSKDGIVCFVFGKIIFFLLLNSVCCFYCYFNLV